MAAFVRKVYDIDNDKNIINLDQRPLDVEALGFSIYQASREIRH
jgi:hypothetical protein